MKTTPVCLYFGKCGGCTSQDLDYSSQVDAKKNHVAQLLNNEKISISQIKVFSKQPYGYRTRMDFAFCPEGVGLRKKKKWNQIVPISRCEISNDKLNELLAQVLEFHKTEKPDVFDLKKQTGTFKYAVIRTPENTDETSVTFILNLESEKIPESIALVEKFSKKTTAKNVIIGFVKANADMSIAQNVIVKKGKGTLSENLLGKKITYFSQAFFQNNTRMAEEMIKYCKELLKGGKTLVDLYGGAGTFGISLCEVFSRTIIIDNDEGNILSARKNIEENGLKNIEAIHADAQHLSELKEKEITLLTDPPRTGMHQKVINEIMTRAPSKIIYISCNPKQMAKELAIFKEKYEVKSLAVFDLFPQTEHIEAIAELSLIQ